MTIDFNPWAPALTKFVEWLDAEDQTAADSWSGRLKSDEANKAEGAVAEALVWDYIYCRVDSVRLAEKPGLGGVDFEFSADDRRFLVEVTNISIEAATRGCKMPDTELFKGFYSLLTDRIRRKVRGKLKQASQHAADPLLVAVTTLHWNASHACVHRHAVEFALASPPAVTSKWNPETGMAEGDLCQSTDLRQSVFLSPTPILGPDGQPIAQAGFQPISGFLLGGFGLEPRHVRVYGALNPEATHRFDPGLLGDVPFCSFKNWPVSTRIELTWTISEEDDERRARKAAEKRLRAAGFGELLDETRRCASEDHSS